MRRHVAFANSDWDTETYPCRYVIDDHGGNRRPCARRADHKHLFCRQHRDHMEAVFRPDDWDQRGRAGDFSELDVLRARLMDAEARARTPESSVYYIERPADGLIKIGFSIRPAVRLEGLGGRADALRLLAIELGGREVEYLRHRQFERLRVVGEWFTPGPALLRHIQRLQAVQERLVLPPASGERP